MGGGGGGRYIDGDPTMWNGHISTYAYIKAHSCVQGNE